MALTEYACESQSMGASMLESASVPHVADTAHVSVKVAVDQVMARGHMSRTYPPQFHANDVLPLMEAVFTCRIIEETCVTNLSRRSLSVAVSKSKFNIHTPMTPMRATTTMISARVIPRPSFRASIPVGRMICKIFDAMIYSRSPDEV